MTELAQAQNPSQRLLILCPSSDTSRPQFESFLTALTDREPPKDVATYAGYTAHPPLRLRTKYYAADVSLWCDEIPAIGADEPSLATWIEQMLSEEAKEVREAIGSMVLLLPRNRVKDDAQIQEYVQYIEAVTRLGYQIDDESGRDFTTIAVLQDMTPAAAADNASGDKSCKQDDDTAVLERLQDTCVSDHGLFGWEFVSLSASTVPNRHASDIVNEEGERTGLARVIEVLEQIKWSSILKDGIEEQDEDDIDDVSLEGEHVPNTTGKTLEYHSTLPLLAANDETRKDHAGEEDDDNQRLQVEQLSNLMQHVTSIREASSDMSREDRENFAKKEVAKIMKELDIR